MEKRNRLCMYLFSNILFLKEPIHCASEIYQKFVFLYCKGSDFVKMYLLRIVPNRKYLGVDINAHSELDKSLFVYIIDDLEDNHITQVSCFAKTNFPNLYKLNLGISLSMKAETILFNSNECIISNAVHVYF